MEDIRKGRSAGLKGATGLVLLLGGCATLPAREAGAFRDLSTAQRDAFTGLSDAERIALTAFATSEARAPGSRWLTERCGDDPAETRPCVLTFREAGGGEFALTTAARNARAMIGGLANYGEQMAELAEAADLEEAKRNTQAVGASVKALATAVGAAPIIGPVVDMAALAGSARLKQKRRRVLLEAARAAHPVVELAAVKLGEIAEPLKRNMLTVSSTRVRNAMALVGRGSEEEAILAGRIAKLRSGSVQSAWRTATIAKYEDRLAALRTKRSRATTELVQASTDLNAGRAISTDYSKLAGAHAKLLAGLENPSVDIEDALADLTEFLTIMDALATAA